MAPYNFFPPQTKELNRAEKFLRFQHSLIYWKEFTQLLFLTIYYKEIMYNMYKI